MTFRVTSEDFSAFSPWTAWKVGDVYRDERGGPALERVVKVCRDARGNERLRGCGKRFEGWVLAAEPLPLKVRGFLTLKFKQQLTEDGAILGLCDDCLAKIERHRVDQVVVVAAPVQVRRAVRVGGNE